MVRRRSVSVNLLSRIGYVNSKYQPQLASAGPVRPGYLEINRPMSDDQLNWWAGSGGEFFGQWSVSIGPYGGSCSGNLLPDCSGLADPFYVMHFNSEFPIILGVPFTFNETLTGQTWSDWASGEGDGILQQGIGFRLTEADGTPVAVESVPEPASLGLIALPVLLMICWRTKAIRSIQVDRI